MSSSATPLLRGLLPYSKVKPVITFSLGAISKYVTNATTTSSKASTKSFSFLIA